MICKQIVASEEEADRLDKAKAQQRRQQDIQRADDRIAALQQEHIDLEDKVNYDTCQYHSIIRT
jgi:ribosomal protein L9